MFSIIVRPAFANLLAIGFFVLISFHANAQTWPQAEKDGFLNGCIEAAEEGMTPKNAKTYCSCALEKLEKKYPSADKMENVSEAEITAIVKPCLDDIIKTHGDKWDEDDKAIYMKSCMKGIGEEMADNPEAKSFCQCALNKIVAKYSNPFKLNDATQEEIEATMKSCIEDLEKK